MSVLLYTEWSEEQAIYLIVSPKEIIVAKQRDMDDHIQWRVEHEMFEVCTLVTGNRKNVLLL